MASPGRFGLKERCRSRRLRRLPALALCLLLPCLAGTARGEEAEDRETGLESLPERVERTARGFLDHLKGQGLYPYVTSLATGGGAAPGMAYFDPELGRGRVGVYGSASLSFQGDSLVELRLGRVPHEPGRAPRRRLGLEWVPEYVAAPAGQDRFFAYARAAQLDLQAGRYLRGYSDPLQQRSFDAIAGYRIAPGLAVQGRVGMLAVTPAEGAGTLGQVYEASGDVPGRAWQRDFLRVTSELVWDTRVRPRNAQGGSFLSLRLESYQGLGDTPGFRRAAVDLRHFLPLGSDRHVLALRAAGSFARTGGIPVPYYLQYSLGGGSILRSYPEHRFSGDTIYGVSAEYRFQASSWLQLAAFFDGGAASGGFPGLDSHGFRTSSGAGLRLTTRKSVIFRFDVARGSEGTRFNAKVGYSF
jgi:hypothetical protein